MFVVTAFSLVACVLLHAHPSLRTVQGGIFLLDAVSENIPSWHGLCLSCMVIASAAILVAQEILLSICKAEVKEVNGHEHEQHQASLLMIASIAIWILDNYCIFIEKLETGDSQDLEYGVFRIRREVVTLLPLPNWKLVWG